MFIVGVKLSEHEVSKDQLNVWHLGQTWFYSHFPSLSSDTGRGLGESPEGGPAPALNPHPHEKTPTPHRPPITPKRRCDRHAPPRAPGPGRRQDPAPVRALGPDPGPDASQEDVRKVSAPLLSVIVSAGPESWSFVEKWSVCFDMNVNVPWTICRKLVFAAPF